jgi:hypothetical protein
MALEDALYMQVGQWHATSLPPNGPMPLLEAAQQNIHGINMSSSVLNTRVLTHGALYGRSNRL